MLVAVLLWLLLAVSYGYATVSSKLALPPTPELYVHTVGFQVLQFVYFKLPALSVLLGVVLAAQFFLAQIRRSLLPPHSKKLLRFSLGVAVAVLFVTAGWYNLASSIAYNPYFQRDEQLALAFLGSWVPGLSILMAGVLVAEYQWLRKKAG